MADMISAKSSSLSDISHLSDDLLAEIFKRLPFRSTAGSKCVSKRWLDLISKPYFLRQFISHQHSLHQALLIFLTPHELMLAFLLPPWEEPPYVPPSPAPEIPFSPGMLIKGNVCGCSNGLLLCCNNRYTTGTGYYVYDPLTRKRDYLPPSPALQKENLYAVGFIYDPYNDDDDDDDDDTGGGGGGGGEIAKSSITTADDRGYRVVIIRSFIRRAFEFELDVYSSEAGRWKKVFMSCPDGFAFAPHWLLSFAYDGSLYFMGRTGIFVFDPYTKHSFTLEYPEDADPMNIMSFGFLGSSCGCLRIADIGHNDLRVWELDEDIWHLLHRTNLTTKLPEKFCANYYKRVAGFHPYDSDVVYLHSYADGVFVANLRTDKFEAIPGYEKSDISPFQLELPWSLPPMPSTG